MLQTRSETKNRNPKELLAERLLRLEVLPGEAPMGTGMHIHQATWCGALRKPNSTGMLSGFSLQIVCSLEYTSDA